MDFFVFVFSNVVTAAFEEPVPGWIDNLHGPTGIFVSIGKGILRSIFCNVQNHVELIPVDFAINSLIGIGHKVATEEK